MTWFLDIEVPEDPATMLDGADSQHDRAIAYLLGELEHPERNE